MQRQRWGSGCNAWSSHRGCLWLMAALLPLQVKDGTSRFFRWMLAGAAVQRAESASAPPACLAVSGLDPQVGIRGLSVAVPHGGVWELGKVQLGGAGDGGSPGGSFGIKHTLR